MRRAAAKETGLQLPIARVKRIVKADPDVKLISSDATFLIAKSAVRATPKLCGTHSAHPR